jgi:hypothetical protein
VHRLDHSYEVGNKILIKFGKGAKLGPRFVRPFEDGKRKGPVAY